MIRILSGSALALALAACASAPSATPATLILGTWTCSTTSEGMAIAGVLDYRADGTVKGDAMMDADMPGMKASITGDVDATWAFLPDGKLQETITALKVKSAVLDGQAAPAAMIPLMIQPMVNESVVNQSSISTAVFAAETFTSTDEEGVVTSCKR